MLEIDDRVKYNPRNDDPEKPLYKWRGTVTGFYNLLESGRNAVVDLDNGHWAYGYQLTEMEG